MQPFARLGMRLSAGLRRLIGSLLFLQVAQQEAERARFIVTRAEQDKKSTIVRAKGEAEAAKLIGQAIQNNPAFMALRKIEAAREIADTIATAPNKLYLNSDALLLNMSAIDVSGAKK
jgi:prohibitin 2